MKLSLSLISHHKVLWTLHFRMLQIDDKLLNLKSTRKKVKIQFKEVSQNFHELEVLRRLGLPGHLPDDKEGRKAF